ncbi:MAG: LytTR family DNA-binding domain-containing protein [Lachnospiraceae bacterium]|nr:LytTR family DNA-binding domain-containing protein [Lachnospiraceae bacterium]
MQVNVEIEPSCKVPYATIHASQMNGEIQRIIEFFSSGKPPITVQNENRFIILQPEEIYMVRVENGSTMVYGKKEKYYSRNRLYELKEQLGRQFMQIAKGTLINLSYMDSVESGFSGTLLLKLKNSCSEYVSRKYLPDFKNYLGL